MAESIERIPTKPGLTTRQWIALAIGVVIVAAVAFVALQLYTTGDEPPIRVRNGSMDLRLDSGKWEDNGGDGWSPSEGKNRGKAVTVVSANNHRCKDGQTANGNDITVWYSDGFEATLKAAGLFKPKTKVRPKDKLENVDPPLLRYGVPNDTGWISKIEVSGGGPKWTCEFNNRNQLDKINICPASNPGC